MSDMALSYVVNLLARREYSEFELRNKMQEKMFSEQEIENVLRYCQQKHWQSDRRFAENYINARAQRGYGVNRIKQELRQLKGVPEDVIETALEESMVDWSMIALRVLKKKFPHPV